MNTIDLINRYGVLGVGFSLKEAADELLRTIHAVKEETAESLIIRKSKKGEMFLDYLKNGKRAVIRIEVEKTGVMLPIFCRCNSRLYTLRVQLPLA